MNYAAITLGVVLTSLGALQAQEEVGEVAPSARPGVEHASLRPVEDGERAPVPALPPDLPSDLPAVLLPDELGRDGADNSRAAVPDPRDRDPFRPFTLDLKPKKVADETFLTPLQRYDLQQLTVVGVLLDLEPPRAMVQDDAGMGYIVTPGTQIGRRSGVVTDVQPRQIIVEETYVDFYGREQVRKAILEMPQEEEVGKNAKPGRNKKPGRK